MQRPELKSPTLGPLKVQLQVEQWPYLAPFRITGHMREFIEVLVVSLHQDGRVGRGEAAGVRYRNDTVTRMLEQIEALRAQIETGISRDTAQMLLPGGGARNALDCALWDLEAKLSGHPVWTIAGLDKPHPLLTVFTCGADEPRAMATQARAYAQARAIKLKLTGDPLDAERVRRVRQARSDVWLMVDANQGFTLSSLEKLMPTLIESRVTVIEQPFRIGEDALLDQFQSPIPVAADESAQQLADVPGLVGRFNMVNIKLDKCGGLTEALAMARAGRALGLDVMVGNMGNTSLAMAPAFVLGQICQVVDLDGPIFLKNDREPAVRYLDGFISCPEGLWGE